jgi:hypothetical protein
MCSIGRAKKECMFYMIVTTMSTKYDVDGSDSEDSDNQNEDEEFFELPLQMQIIGDLLISTSRLGCASGR